MAKSEKVQFCPVQPRAYKDVRLTALDHRLLACVAHHDRFRNNGKGCFVNLRKMAEMTKAHYTNVSKSLKRLEAFGYIESWPNPKNNRQHVYSLIYNDEFPTVGETTNYECIDPETGEIVGELTNNEAPIVGEPILQASDNKEQSGPKQITSKVFNRFSETDARQGKKKNQLCSAVLTHLRDLDADTVALVNSRLESGDYPEAVDLANLAEKHQTGDGLEVLLINLGMVPYQDEAV